jgi:hypothetical protein
MSEFVQKPPRFYFSLLRFIAMLRGGDTRRAESNEMEARLVGFLIYLIHYLFFAMQFVSFRLASWVNALLLIALAFWVWLFWLLLLYINSVLIKFLRLGGIFRAIPTRRAQSILWGITTTVMACVLLKNDSWIRELSAIWLVTVALNLIAAAVLTFRNAAASPGK